MTKKHEYRYEVSRISDDAGIIFLDIKTKKQYRLDEEKRELLGVGDENWGERIKITKATDIETTVPYFRKTGVKLKGYYVYENIKGDRFVHDKIKGLFIGIDPVNKNIVLHVKSHSKIPSLGTIPFIHKPLYIGKVKASQYPFAFMGISVAGIQTLIPLVEELSAINPVLAGLVYESPIIAGAVAEGVMRNKTLQKDVKKFEKLVQKEYHRFRKWEKSNIEKRLEKVI